MLWNRRGLRWTASAAYWLFPSLFCVILYWYGLFAWFQQDDFVWVGLYSQVHSWGDLGRALFAPTQHGTLRPLSERAFFLIFYALFGLDSLPYRILVFLTQFGNLVLIAAITRRITGSRLAGFLAPLFWIANTAMYVVMSWSCEYILVLCGFCILLAFYFLLRYVETGDRRFYTCQWVVFLAGFGAMETNVVYPAIAAVYTFLFARRYFRKTLPLFGVSIVYVGLHFLVAPRQTSGPYAVHIDSAIPATFLSYWKMALEPTRLQELEGLPDPVGLLLFVLFTFALLGFTFWMMRRGQWQPLFFLAWFVIVLGPVLPLREHVTQYYLTLPMIGLSMLAAHGVAYARQSHSAWLFSATLLSIAFFATAIPVDWKATRWWYQRSLIVENLVRGVMRAHELHPGKTILLDNVNDDLFWGAFYDFGFHAVGIDDVYLVPGSEAQIHQLPESRFPDFVMPPGLTMRGLDENRVEVYLAGAERLTNVTRSYAQLARARLKPETPRRLNVANPLAGDLLGPGWYPRETGFRWTRKQVTLRLGGPVTKSQRLYVTGICPKEQLNLGPLTMTISVDGRALPSVRIAEGDVFFHFDFPASSEWTGKDSVEIAVEVDRTTHLKTRTDIGEVGVAFGIFEFR